MAIGLGRFFDIPLGSFGEPEQVEPGAESTAVALGIARDLGVASIATLLPLAMMVRLTRQSGPWGERMRATTREILLPFLQPFPIWALIMLSLAAGWGEELFFRGFLYSAVLYLAPGPFGAVLAFWATSLLFGVCHWVHVEYAVLATAMGAYLALLLIIFDSLWVPIFVHAIYDFVAMLYIKYQSSSESIA